jgi:hypothetical protein
MRGWIVFFGVSVGLLGNECSEVKPIKVGDPTFGKVTVWAIAPADATAVSGSVELIDPKERTVRFRFATGQTTDVPFGKYVARVHASGFSTEEFDLTVYRADTSVRIPVHFGMACLPDNTFSVSGAIKGRLAGRDLWVKLIPLIGNGGREVRASPLGYFVFDGVEIGGYALLIAEKNTLVRTQVITVDKFLSVALELN